MAAIDHAEYVPVGVGYELHWYYDDGQPGEPPISEIYPVIGLYVHRGYGGATAVLTEGGGIHSLGGRSKEGSSALKTPSGKFSAGTERYLYDSKEDWIASLE